MPLDALKLVKRDHERSKGDPMEREWFEVDADTLFTKTIPYFEALRAGDEALTPRMREITGFEQQLKSFTDSDMKLVDLSADAPMKPEEKQRRYEVLQFLQ